MGQLQLPERMNHCPCANCRPTDLELQMQLDRAIGLANARWYRMFYTLEEEDKERVVIQGRPLRYWLQELETATKKDTNEQS